MYVIKGINKIKQKMFFFARKIYFSVNMLPVNQFLFLFLLTTSKFYYYHA